MALEKKDFLKIFPGLNYNRANASQLFIVIYFLKKILDLLLRSIQKHNQTSKKREITWVSCNSQHAWF